MYQIDEIINADKVIFPDLPCDTLILTWYNEETDKDELYLGCEFSSSVCNIHLFIPEVYKTREKIDYAKKEFFPAVLNYVKDKFNSNVITAGCEETNTKMIALLKEVGFSFKNIVLGYMNV